MFPNAICWKCKLSGVQQIVLIFFVVFHIGGKFGILAILSDIVFTTTKIKSKHYRLTAIFPVDFQYRNNLAIGNVCVFYINGFWERNWYAYV